MEEEDLFIVKYNDTIEGPRAHGRATDACENVSIISRKYKHFAALDRKVVNYEALDPHVLSPEPTYVCVYVCVRAKKKRSFCWCSLL